MAGKWYVAGQTGIGFRIDNGSAEEPGWALFGRDQKTADQAVRALNYAETPPGGQVNLSVEVIPAAASAPPEKPEEGGGESVDPASMPRPAEAKDVRIVEKLELIASLLARGLPEAKNSGCGKKALKTITTAQDLVRELIQEEKKR